MDNKKRMKRLLILCMLIAVLGAFSLLYAGKVLAFEDYYVSEDNSFSIVIRQAKSNSSTTIKYATNTWYLFPERINAADYDTVNKEKYPDYPGTKIDLAFYQACGISLKDAVRSTEHVNETYRYDTFTYPAEQIMNAMKKWIAAGTLSRDELKTGIILYASRSLNINKNGTTIGTVYSYPEMERFSKQNYIGWGAKAWQTFYEFTYDQELHVSFRSVPFTSLIVRYDSEGKQISEDSYQLSGFSYNDIYYGESLQGTAPSAEVGYEYIGWELTSGDWSKSGQGALVSYTARNSEVNDSGLVLTFKYKKVKAELPFSSPTPTPTKAPGATATPTPTPTNTPTPAPPTPTSQPTGQTEDWKYNDWYFSTDKGYYMDMVTGSNSYYIANQGGTDGLSVAGASYIKRDCYYLVGTDSAGNEWYFLKSNSDAVAVHPKKYNGYLVDSADVKYITELVFPASIRYGGTSYTVRTIGGGTAMYKQTAFSPPSSSTTYYEYGPINGYYYNDVYNTSSSQINDIGLYVTYAYGVIGNGAVTSNGFQHYYYLISGGSIIREYAQNYYFYNTTLKKLVIPDTVTGIEQYAFRYCQAIETIEGGANLTSILNNGFSVNGNPEIKLSTNDSIGQQSYQFYYYYNKDYSTASYTTTMLEWRAASFLSDALIFPYLPRLTAIGNSAFSGHHNIDEVDLSSTVAKIGSSAFLDCRLDRIRIPNASCVIDDSVECLGTRGYSITKDTTEIYCDPDSAAMNYGLKYDGNYVLFCGYPVIYVPNGAPGHSLKINSALNIHYGMVDDNGIRLTYPNYVRLNSDYYSYRSQDCRYQSYLDPDGALWELDTTNKTMTLVSPGTKFTDLFQINSAHFAIDSDGNYWVSGQQEEMSTYTDSWGDLSWYTYYSDFFHWRKMVLPSGVKKMIHTSTGVFVLDNDGNIWRSFLKSQSNRKLTMDNLGFADFSFMTYAGDTDGGKDAFLAGITADGNVYCSYETDYDGYKTAGFSLHDYAGLYESDYKMFPTCGKQVELVLHGGVPKFAVLTEQGELHYYNSPYPDNTPKKYTSYTFTEFKQGPCAYSSTRGLLIKDASGNTYSAYPGYGLSLKKIAGPGVGIKDIWYTNMTYSSLTYATDDYSETSSWDGFIVWTDDGYVAKYGATNSNYDGRMAGVGFSKVLHGRDIIYALATDGTLYSAGNNEYGQLGHAGSYNYSYPHQNDALRLKQTSTRTYQDVYANLSSWAIAFGTDGKIYYTGYKPTPSYGSSSYSDRTYNFTALGSEYSWPVASSLPLLRTGYDYNTKIANSMFTYSGYDFKEWNTAADGTGTAYYPGNEVKLLGDLVLYARWGRENNIIRYDRNGGTGSMSNTVLPYNVTTTTLELNKYAREGYEFIGWNTYSDGTGAAYADGASITVTKGSTTTLYAQWREIVTGYTLIYMKYPYGTVGNVVWKQKTLSNKSVELVEGQPFIPSGTYTVTYSLNQPSGMSTVPAALDKTEDSTAAPAFFGWKLYTKNQAGVYTYSGKQYTKGKILSSLTVENGGVVYMYPAWNQVNSYVVLPYTEAEGYVFEGFSESKDGSGSTYPVYPPEEEENIAMFTPVKDTVLYGKWSPLKKSVTLDATNRAAIASGINATVTQAQEVTEFTFDTMALPVAAPVCERFIFMGYYTKLDADGTPAKDSIKVYDTNKREDGSYAALTQGVVITNNINGSFDEIDTLYAYWRKQEVTVLLDDRGATGKNHTDKVVMEPGKKGPEIIVPSKTGYTFQGYYTEIRGKGEKYYDSSGVCIKAWEDGQKEILYAYWIQKETEFPKEEQQPIVTPLPEAEVNGCIRPSGGRVQIYADDYDRNTGAVTDRQPYLVSQAIPGTEALSVRARLPSWLLNYTFQRVSGTDMVRIYVTVPYRTQYECSLDETLVISERKVITKSFMIPKHWSYWEIKESGLYYPKQLVLSNEAFKDGVIEIEVKHDNNQEALVPSYEVACYADKELHVFWEEYDADKTPVLRITLEEQYIISELPDTLPDVERYIAVVAGNAAKSDLRQASVRSDSYSFNGQTILSDEIKTDGSGSELCESLLPEANKEVHFTAYEQTYQSGIFTDEFKPNGLYETIAAVLYEGSEKNIGMQGLKTLPVTDVNSINIHTPVVCHAEFTEGISGNGEDRTLILKDAFNYITLCLDNRGTHRMNLGYGYKDFRTALSGKSNIAMNQVKFPFNVFVDAGNDYVKDNGDFLLEAETWFTVSTTLQQFYVPVTTQNGVYEIQFRTIAVNCPKDKNGNYSVQETEKSANILQSDYTATDSVKVEVKSFLKDVRITGVTDPLAAANLNAGRQALTIKLGYHFSYELVSFGEFFGNNAEIVAEPRYFWEAADGSERKEVKLYFQKKLPYEEKKECFAWSEEPLLEQFENYEVIVQNFSGSGMIPADVLCVDKDFVLEEYTKQNTLTGKEPFLHQSGYLVIQLNIRVKSNSGVWYTFEDWHGTKIAQHAKEEGWNYQAGDMIRYELSKSIADDYEIGGSE